jgi:hypothetical protein
VRYVIEETFDNIEQRCLDARCTFVNGTYSEPRRNCVLCQGPLGAYLAYGTQEQRDKRLIMVEAYLRDWTR